MLTPAEQRWVRSLSRRRQREKERVFLAEGVRVVEELLACGVVPRLALVSSSLGDTERGRALAETLATRTVMRRLGGRELGELADTETNQGVLVVAETPEHGLDEHPLTGSFSALVLDGVQDPGNLGTLVRTAVAFGVELVACLSGTVEPWNPKAVRASAGALFRLRVVRPEVESLLEWLDHHGITMLGADAAGDPVDRMTVPERVALAVGNEGAGLGAAVRGRCSGLVAVPMRGGTESLNVAVAAGILLYLITRERG